MSEPIPALNVGVLFFPDVEELDAVGPWEVFKFWQLFSGDEKVTVTSLSLDGKPVRCAKGLGVSVDAGLGDSRLDLLLYPGGHGASVLADTPSHVADIRAIADQGTVIASVCTGAMVLARAGLLRGTTATTHWHALDALRSIDPTITIDAGARFVDQGPTLTAAGVSAGIDLALHIVERYDSSDVSEKVARVMEYHPAPATAE